MFRLTLQTIRAGKARFFLTAVAVILGVAFMAGTLVLTDTINKAYDGIAGTTFASTDVVVQSPQHRRRRQRTSTERGTIPASVRRRRARRRRCDRRRGRRRRHRPPRRSRRQARRRQHAADPADRHGVARRPTASTRCTSSRGTRRARPTRSSSTARRPVTASSHPATPCAWSPSPVRRSTPSPASRPTGPTTTPVARGSWRSRRRPRPTVLGEPGRVDSVRAVGAAGVTQSELAARVRGRGAERDRPVEVSRSSRARPPSTRPAPRASRASRS